MYFRRPLNKIIKVRPVFGQMKFSRYCHTSYSRHVVLLKCNESRTAKNPLLLPTFSRSFAVGNGKDNGSKERKSSSTPDLTAPNFRSDLFLKLTSKNREAMGDKIYFMPQKSLTLKMCRQSSKSLSTFQTSVACCACDEKADKKEETDRTETKYKADYCRHICGPNSANLTAGTNALKPPTEHKVTESIIEKLTDAEIREICQTRCPCSEAHVTSAPQNFENVKSQSTAADLMNNLENPSNPPTQSTLKLQDSSAGNIETSTTSQSTALYDSSTGRIEDTTNIKKIGRHRRTWPTNNQMPMINGSRQTNPIDRRAPKDSYIRSSAGSVHPMPSIPFQSLNKRKSKYARLIRSGQISNSPAQATFPKYRIHPRLTFGIDTRLTFRMKPLQTNPRQKYHIGPLPAPYGTTTQYNATRPLSLQTFQTQLKPNTNPNAGFATNVCHFEQLKPVPFRYMPIYHKNYHYEPVIENRVPSFDPMYMRVPYPPINIFQMHERQNNHIKSPVFGSESGKNRQMIGIQSNLPNIVPYPTGFTAASINNNKVSTDRTKEMTLPVSEIKPQPKDSPSGGIETLQKSRKIMSELVENLSVVVDGPGKLKLTTAPYPKLRDDKDVIIQMEYVNLTDADARHYLTGKYNPYSYATTTAGRTGSGIIIETGPAVQGFKPGDKVFIKPSSCGKCSLCLSDHRNLCEHVTATELSPMVGILSRLHVNSSEFVTRIPDNVSPLNGAMTGTLSTAIRACQKASVSVGDVVLVIGGGALGMATSLAAQSLGATTVCLADIRRSILGDATNLGIEKVFQIDPRSPSKNTAIKLWEHIGVYPRVTFDCTGLQLTNEIAINATQTGGKVIVMTNIRVDIPLPVSNLVARNIDVIICTCGSDESHIAALRLLSTKRIFFGKDLHKHYDLSNANEAFENLLDPNRFDSHVIVKCGCACGQWVSSENKKSF